MKYRDENGDWQELYLSPTGDTLPIGSINTYAGTNAPSGWLICNGSEISRGDYPELFKAIGTTYGEGDGSTTFNIPDLQGKTIVGLNSEDTDFETIGKTGGEKTHTLTVDEIPSHNHNATVAGKTAWGGQSSLAFESGGAGFAPSGGVAGITISKSGGDKEHNNLQPYMTLNYIIKAKNSVGIVGTVVDTLDITGENYVPNVDAVNNKFTEIGTYSTKETRIGTWIDGKPIYRKVISILPDYIKKSDDYEDVTFPHNISNIGQLTRFDMIGSQNYILPGVSKNGLWTVPVQVDSTNIILRHTDSWGNITFYFILEYTKTID
jgi:microcystin-dependent protein